MFWGRKIVPKFIPFFSNFGNFDKEDFSIRVFHKLVPKFHKPMENSVENVENLAKSSFFGGDFLFFKKFTYGKLFVEACQVLFENNSLSAFCTKNPFFKFLQQKTS